METFPPPDYVPTKSAVAGIELYMPRPPEEKHQEVVDFVCPQCAGKTAYSAAGGGLTCTYCSYYEPPQHEVVGKGAEEFEFTVETMARAAHGWGTERKELVCQSCSAHTTLATDMLSHSCPFCGSNQVIQARAPQDVLRPRFLIPFTVTEEACQQRLKQWLGSSWMTPSALRRVAHVAGFIPIYIPFWTFDARTRAHWRAEVGHTKRETYYSGGKRRTRTKTVWRWESGHVDLFIDDLVIPGTTKLSSLLLGRIRNYDLRALVPYEPAYLAGMQAQAYDVTLEVAWGEGRQKMRARTKKACMDQASSSKIRNFSMTLDFADESWRYILVPVYTAVYRYQNQGYQVMVNGQSGRIAGQRPVDWRKVGAVMAALLLPALIMAIVAWVTAVPGSDNPWAFFAIVAFVLGAIIDIVIFVSAQRMDDV